MYAPTATHEDLEDHEELEENADRGKCGITHQAVIAPALPGSAVEGSRGCKPHLIPRGLQPWNPFTAGEPAARPAAMTAVSTVAAHQLGASVSLRLL
jgi:hypothetical protein